MSGENRPGDLIEARAVLLGERLQLRGRSFGAVEGINPLVVRMEQGGLAVLFRFGVAVLFGIGPQEETKFLHTLQDGLVAPQEGGESENLTLRVDPQAREVQEGNELAVPDLSVGRLQVIADVLAKSVLLADYEARVAEVFDRVEPLAEQLQRRGRGVRSAHHLLRHIGETLQIRQRLVGRAQIDDKPEVLWDQPQFDRLYLHLAAEYEIAERQLALERKLALIGDTAETLVDLLHNSRSLRVEWYIVILIVVEIGLTLYELFVRGH